MSMTRAPSPIALVLPALALCTWAGCNLAPKYNRPAIETPAQFREAATPVATDTGVSWTAAQPGDATARGAWWELYGDPQLNTLETQVETSNQSLAAAAANFRAARAALASARSAFLPKLTAAPSFSRSRASQALAAPAPGTPTVVDEYALPFDATYEVDLWGRVRNSVALSAANAQASAADLATARLSLQAELAQDYFQLRAIDAERQILDETVDSYRKSLDETSALFRAGIDSQEDVARAETQLNTAIAQATDFGVSRAAFEHAIAVLIGRAPANFTLPVAPLTTRPPPLPVGLPSNLLERRPDIAAAERHVAAANAQIGLARAAYFPSLTLGATGGWESRTFSHLLEGPSRFWSVGPQLAATLFDGGAIRAQTEQARAAYDAAAANYRQTVLGAFQAVEDNLAALRVLDQEAREQQIAVNSAQHLLDLANTRFRTGIDSYLNVITAQTALLSNRETNVQIQLRQVTASLSLVKALGGGWSAAQLPAMAAN
jgi:NodT family efflux transporter outer membrane factor (OMF) lipoprotein